MKSATVELQTNTTHSVTLAGLAKYGMPSPIVKQTNTDSALMERLSSCDGRMPCSTCVATEQDCAHGLETMP
jgi:hypothetical protein